MRQSALLKSDKKIEMNIYFDAPQNEEKMQKSNTSDKDVDAEGDMYYLINKILIYDLL